MNTLKASVAIAELTFSDGTKLDLEGVSNIVLVGPNNAGKSRALKDIEKLARSGSGGLVVVGAKFSKSGGSQEITDFLELEFKATDETSYRKYSGWGTSIYSHQLAQDWQNSDVLGSMTNLFIRRLKTDDRLSGSNAIASIDLRKQTALHPFHSMSFDDILESKIDALFNLAFSENLIVDRFRGSKVGLLVGLRPIVDGQNEDRVSNSYREKLDNHTELLEEQGDGMRAFSTVISASLSREVSSILLIDEPEAFLHPPQAKLLGSFFGSESSAQKQFFIATHSVDFLKGILSTAEGRTIVVRLERDGSVNRANMLSLELIKRMSTDSVIKQTEIMNAVFHRRAILCESDSDSMFYGAIAECIESDSSLTDIRFLHSGGKHRMPAMSSALRDMGVRFDVIVDIDILREKADFRRLIEAVGGSWDDFENDYDVLREALMSQQNEKRTSDLQDYIKENVLEADPSGRPDKKWLKDIRELYSKATIWGHLKRAGRALIPSGGPSTRFNSISANAEQLGLWVVPVGEVEGFAKTVDSHGPKWVQKVLSRSNICSDDELEPARKFVLKVLSTRE